MNYEVKCAICSQVLGEKEHHEDAVTMAAVHIAANHQDELDRAKNKALRLHSYHSVSSTISGRLKRRGH